MTPDPVTQPTYRGCPVVLLRLRKGPALRPLSPAACLRRLSLACGGRIDGLAEIPPALRGVPGTSESTGAGKFG
jgi:hypothetical protein